MGALQSEAAGGEVRRSVSLQVDLRSCKRTRGHVSSSQTPKRSEEEEQTHLKAGTAGGTRLLGAVQGGHRRTEVRNEVTGDERADKGATSVSPITLS